jgi:hypothetical protein
MQEASRLLNPSIRNPFFWRHHIFTQGCASLKAVRGDDGQNRILVRYRTDWRLLFFTPPPDEPSLDNERMSIFIRMSGNGALGRRRKVSSAALVARSVV